MFCGSGGSKSRLAKAAGAEPPGQMRDEKLHAVVARSTFGSEKCQNTPCSDHVWKLRCWKSARRCGAKHIGSEKWQNTPFSEHFWTSEGQRHVAAVRNPPERGTKVCFDYLGLSEFMSKCCNPFCTFLLRNVLRTTTACTFSILQLLKVVRTWCALYILTWKCASRHNCVHFLDISTSKSAPHVRCFSFFPLQFFFAPQRRATFHLSSPPAPAALASLLFDLPHTSLEQHNESRLFFLFAHLHLLSSHSFSSLIFPLLLFSSLALPTSACPSVHIVGS